MKGVKSRFVLIATFSLEQHDYEGCAHPGATPSDCQPSLSVGEKSARRRKKGFQEGGRRFFAEARSRSRFRVSRPAATWAQSLADRVEIVPATLDTVSLDEIGTPPQFARSPTLKTIRVIDTLKQTDFVERRDAAAAAKARLIEKMRQAPKHDDPTQLEKRAAKALLQAATALQRSERYRLKLEAEARKQADEPAAARAAVAA